MKLNKLAKFYETDLLMKGISAIAGEQKEFVVISANEIPETEVLQAFLDDDDLQQITVCSANIGFVRTFLKIRKGTVYSEYKLHRTKSKH